jgi:UDP-N-acetylmuramoyl-L-alanyl-D-glutamate--2,6-diaminopimelate ligase
MVTRGRGVALSDLIEDTSALGGHERSRPVAGVASDSRHVEPGFLFVAVAGVKSNGADFIAAAVAAGAIAVAAEAFPAGMFFPGVSLVQVPNARAALSKAAAGFYTHQPETVVAVTGTNGKTSVASFLRQIWCALGKSAASIGTVGIVGPQGTVASSLTTPDTLSLHRIIDEMARDGVTHLAFEASSHGLDQHRLDGLRLSAGAFTNLSRDHLDYHATLEHYRAAKLRLFNELLPEGAAAVICADGGDASAFVNAARHRHLHVLTVGVAGEDIQIVQAEPEGYGQSLLLRCKGKERRISLPLPGGFQAENALVAAGLAIATGCDMDDVLGALEHLTGAPGRLEKVGESNGALVVVDYAHTPDALANALDALRPYVSGHLSLVFGAGGDRDAGKRPLMGEVAAQKADFIIVTDDNPRSEDPASIRRAVLAAVPHARDIGDRALAIATAIKELHPGDVLLVAGKGHESGQIVGQRTLPFSDHAAILAAIGGYTHRE